MPDEISPLSPEHELEILQEKAYRIVKRWRNLTPEQEISLLKKACIRPLKAPLWDEKAIGEELSERLATLHRKLPAPKRNHNQQGRIVLEYVGGATAKNRAQPSTEHILEKKASKVHPWTEYSPAIEHTSWRRREIERAIDIVGSILQAAGRVSQTDREVLENFLKVVLPNDTINSIAIKLGMDRTELRRVLDRAQRVADIRIFAQKGYAVAATQPVLIDKLLESALDDFPPATKLFLPGPNALSSDQAWRAAGAPVASDQRCRDLVGVYFPGYNRDWYEALKHNPLLVEGPTGERLVSLATPEITPAPASASDVKPLQKEESPARDKIEALEKRRRMVFKRWNNCHHGLRPPCSQCSADIAEIKEIDEKIKAARPEEMAEETGDPVSSDNFYVLYYVRLTSGMAF